MGPICFEPATESAPAPIERAACARYKLYIAALKWYFTLVRTNYSESLQMILYVKQSYDAIRLAQVGVFPTRAHMACRRFDLRPPEGGEFLQCLSFCHRGTQSQVWQFTHQTRSVGSGIRSPRARRRR